MKCLYIDKECTRKPNQCAKCLVDDINYLRKKRKSDNDTITITKEEHVSAHTKPLAKL